MSKALLKFIRLSPTKARLIAREVQGMDAESALASLEFTSNKAARIIAKVIASAVANGGYEAKNVIVYSCRVDGGPVLRRFMPRARGRATPIRKPTSHILVEVMTQSEIDSQKQRQKKDINKNTAASKKASASTKNAQKKPQSAEQAPKKEPKPKVESSAPESSKPSAQKKASSSASTKASTPKGASKKDTATKATPSATKKPTAKKPKDEDK